MKSLKNLVMMGGFVLAFSVTNLNAAGFDPMAIDRYASSSSNVEAVASGSGSDVSVAQARTFNAFAVSRYNFSMAAAGSKISSDVKITDSRRAEFKPFNSNRYKAFSRIEFAADF